MGERTAYRVKSKDGYGGGGFNDECCDITLSDRQHGIVDSERGFVSSSGFGDGSYPLNIALEKNSSKVAGASVVFIRQKKTRNHG